MADALFARAPWAAHAPPGWKAPANKLLLDQVTQVYPWLDYARTRLAAGELPLWNPHAACGTPFLANANAGLFSPFHLLAWIAPSTAAGLTAVALAKIAVAMAGTWALARALGAGATGAALAALTYALGGPSLVWLGHALTTVSPLLPWSLLAAERLVRGATAADADARARRRAAAALAALTAAAFLGSHPETAVHVAGATAVYGLLRAWRAPRPRAGAVRLAAALALGFLAASVQTVPFLLALRDSHWRVLRGETPRVASVPAAALPLVWAPHLYGTPMALNHREDLTAGTNFAECCLFAGVLPLVLVPAAGRALRRDPAWTAVAILGALALLVALDPLGVPGAVLRALPLIGLGAHARLVVVWTLALALLFGAAAERLLADPRALSARAAAGAAAAGVLALAWGVVRAGAPAPRAIAGVGLALVLIAAGVAAVRLRRHLPPRALAAGLVGLTLADLWAFGHAINPTLAPAHVFPPTAATSFAAAAADKAPASPFRVLGLGRALPANAAGVYRLDDVRGYEPLATDRFQRVWSQTMTPRGAWEDVRWSEVEAPRVLALLGVRYVFDAPGDPPPDDPLLSRVLGADARVHEVAGVMPRAFVVHAFDVESDPAAAGRRLREGYDFRTRVLVDRAPGPPPEQLRRGGGPDPAPQPAADDGSESVALWSPRPEELRVAVRLAAAGILVVAESFDRGWSARTGGRAVPLLVAHGAFQAVALPAGAHDVVLSYRPPGLVLGAALSLAALALIALVRVWP